MKRLRIRIDGVEKEVARADYVRFKHRDLKDFGYTSLTREEVEEQLQKLLDGEELNVIGMFMQDEVTGATP